MVKLSHLALMMLCLVEFSSVLCAREKAAKDLPYSDISVAKVLQDTGGDYSDIFVKLKENSEFLTLSDKYDLDNPAAWSLLRNRFVLRVAELQGDVDEAKSMMATPDSRSKLTNDVVSSETIREKGRALFEDSTKEINELQQSLRLIDEFEGVFEEVSSKHAITDEINIRSKTGKSLTGQVLLIDGNDLIVKRQNGDYFRIPSSMLSGSTKFIIIESVINSWKPLLGLVEDKYTIEQNSGELIAYSDSLLYIEDKYEGFVPEQRANSKFVFKPYEEQIEVLMSANDDKKKRKPVAELKALEEGISLNLERIKTIDFYESRLGTKLPESERKLSNAYRKELISGF